ncbi:metallophosphatase [Caballeronia megalochromosomata]|nr:metallophosphatase [Caballeronia megalochromosomata]
MTGPNSGRCTVKLLHTADWQIGEAFGQFEIDEATLLGAARIESVKTVAKLAAERAVDIVVVAGDVFDQQDVQDHIVRRMFDAMGAYAGRWVLIPGNHDAAKVESVWTRAAKLKCIPQNVIVATKPQTLLFHDLKLALLCAPLVQQNTFEDTTEFFDAEESPEGYCRVGLAHGSMQGVLAEDIDSPNPISSTRAETARLDYLALGDWHGTKAINARTWYAGTHEPDRFKDNDRGNALIVTLGSPGVAPEVETVKTGKYTWRRLERVVSQPTDVELLEAELADCTEAHVVRIAVSGTVDISTREAIEEVISKLRARSAALRVEIDLTTRPSQAEIAALGSQGGYVAKVVDRLNALQSDPSQAKAAADALAALAQFQKKTKEAA